MSTELSPRRGLRRYLVTITVTAVLSTIAAAFLIGAPASAQPSPGAPPVQAVDKDAAAKGAGSAQNPTPASPTAATGSGANTPAAPAGAGSGAPAAAASNVAWYDALANKPVEEEGTFWMPKSVNQAADESDMMFYSVLALSIVFFVAIAGCVIYFVIKYRHRPGHKSQPSAAHNDAMEITWTVIPTIICVFLFYFGWHSYIRVVTPPQKAVEIQVLAQRWKWSFTHANGAEDSDLHVPVNVPVRLVMTSTDVLHSFYAPVFRVKQDIVPRRYTYAWFIATKPGTYRLTCAEYCGTDHSQMSCLAHDPVTNACTRRAVVVVHEPGGYERYLADKGAMSSKMAPEALGKVLYEKKGCISCHTVDGSARVGPTWKDDFDTEVPLQGGGTVHMDEDYIRESMMKPQAKIRQGFGPTMPSFEGQLKEREIQAIIAYIKSLKTEKK